MKIMFIIPRMNSGGAERVVANLANSFSKNNKVMICTLVSDESFYDLKQKNILFKSANCDINRKNKIARLNSYRKNFFRSLKFVQNKIHEFKPDCVISFLVETDIITYLVTRKNKNIVNVYSERNDPTKRNRIIRLVLKHIYKKSDLFVCQSQKVFDYYKSVPNSKKTIIPNPLSENLPTKLSKETKPNIVSVGRFVEQKNFELLIYSFIKVVDLLPNNSNLIIYGDGPLRNKLEKIIINNNMQNRIFLPGVQKNVFEKIKNSALFVMSSNYEGFPNSLIEAMAIGLPVISTDFYTGIAHEIIGPENGIVVPIKNKEKLGEAIVELMKNYDKRQLIRKNNFSIRNKYNSSSISKIWSDKIMKLKR